MESGKYYGSYLGEWLGAQSTDPNAMYGTASFSVSTTGELTTGQAQETGGSGKKQRRVYLERDGQILLFKNAHHAAAYVAAEKAQEKPVEQPRKAPSKVQNVKPISEPVRIEIPVLESFVTRYELGVDVSNLIRQHELDALIALHEQVMRLRDEEDIEILLLAA